MLGPGSPPAGARMVLTTPADCKVPDIALEINSPSFVGLNCELDRGVDVLSVWAAEIV